MKIDFLKNASFHGSYQATIKCPTDGPVIAFTGRSNSGKSSLISTICNHKNLARISSTPGKTRLLNYFKISNQPEELYYIVDMPGFGFAKMSKSGQKKLRIMVDSYLATCQDIILIVVVLDARREIGYEESNILKYCNELKMPVILARTKWDKLNSTEKNKKKNQWTKAGLAQISYPVSSLNFFGLEKFIGFLKQQVNKSG